MEAMTSGDDAPFLFIMNIQVGSYVVPRQRGVLFLVLMVTCEQHARIVPSETQE